MHKRYLIWINWPTTIGSQWDIEHEVDDFQQAMVKYEEALALRSGSLEDVLVTEYVPLRIEDGRTKIEVR